MAKAVAHCTCSICGKEFTKSSQQRNRQAADRWELWAVEYYDECSDCYNDRIAREREKASKQAAVEAAEMELPDLEGSEKQVAWAVKIRKAFIDAMESELVELTEKMSRLKAKGSDRLRNAEASYEKISRTYEHILEEKTSASWWIDRRYDSARSIINSNADQVHEYIEDDCKAANDAIEEATLVPENCTSSGAATIILKEKLISVFYLKDNDFIALVKSLGYRWSREDRRWNKWMTVTTGSQEDRAAELANKLLNAGFSVVLMDAEIRRKAVEADFEPECHRWIVKVKDELVIKTAKDDPVNKEVYKLGCRWSHAADGCVVDRRLWREVLDFAEINGFKISEGAQGIINSARRAAISGGATLLGL